MKLRLFALVMLALTGSLMAYAADEHSIQALEGYDPVAYFTDNKAVRGDGFIKSEHEGLIYLFISKEHKAQFDKNPSKYAPQFGGWCAYGVSVNKKFHADPRAFIVYQDKLYVNVNADILKKFKADLAGNAKKAEGNWGQIQEKAEDSL